MDMVPYVFEQSITSEVVVACMDEFSQTFEKQTVIVMDQASVHQSAAMMEKIEAWRAKNIEIF